MPRTIDDFQEYLLTGTVALTPSFHSLFIAECSNLQTLAFAAAKERSFLAQSMTVLVRGYRSAAGTRTRTRTPLTLSSGPDNLHAGILFVILPRRRLPSRAHAFLQFAPTFKADFQSSWRSEILLDVQ